MWSMKCYFVPGNIDQAQYCERIKGIIELLGSKLSLDELSKIWRIQVSPSAHTHTHTPQQCDVSVVYNAFSTDVFACIALKKKKLAKLSYFTYVSIPTCMSVRKC